MTEQAASVPIEFSTDRSRQISYHRCPRQRFLGYHYGGMGIMRRAMAVPLATGGYTHVGLAQLLTGYHVEDAVMNACDSYHQEVEARGLDLDKEEMTIPSEKAREQLALTEALIRLADLRVIPELLNEYNVVEVEREDTSVLATEDSGLAKVIHRSRADALLTEKHALDTDSPDYYLLNWKTTGSWDRRKAKEGRVDLQGLSEAWGVEERLEIRVLGVKMIHLIKGPEREDSRRPKHYITWSPMIRAWMNKTGPRTEFAWRYEWTDQDKVNDYGKPSKHRLGKGWESFFVPDVMPIAEWMQMLNSNMIQPEAGDCLRAQYITPEPHPRTPQQKASQKRQITHQEVRIAQALIEWKGEGLLDGDEWLEENFPQYTHSCNYPSQCQFFDICHGGESEVDDPFSLFIARKPNHPGELVQIEGGERE